MTETHAVDGARQILLGQAQDVPWVAMAIALLLGALIASGVAYVLADVPGWEGRQRTRVGIGAVVGGISMGLVMVPVVDHWLLVGAAGLAGGLSSVWLTPWMRRRMDRTPAAEE